MVRADTNSTYEMVIEGYRTGSILGLSSANTGTNYTHTFLTPVQTGGGAFGYYNNLGMLGQINFQNPVPFYMTDLAHGDQYYHYMDVNHDLHLYSVPSGGTQVNFYQLIGYYSGSNLTTLKMLLGEATTGVQINLQGAGTTFTLSADTIKACDHNVSNCKQLFP